jgi:hypothetical protein
VPKYDVYATRWDDPHVVDELIPARDLSFSLPLSDHGEASFTATVEPSRSFWRPSVAVPMSGILIARDGVPVWEGWVTGEQQSGPRTFTFTAKEWGYFFEKVRATPRVDNPRARTWWLIFGAVPAGSWSNVNDHQIFRDIITDAQAIAGQNVLVQMGDTLGAHVSDKTINPWDDTSVAREFRAVADAEGGPEWYFQIGGTLDNPVRQLVLGDRLGQTAAQAVLEYVEETPPPPPSGVVPTVALLGDLFPGTSPVVPTRRRGGNLIAWGRTLSVDQAATVVRATGSGDEAARIEAGAEATTLLSNGYPRLTTVSSYSDVSQIATLKDHAVADLERQAGVATGYSLVSFDGDPTADWTQTPRGSSVRVVLDTDVLGTDRPVGGPDGFELRCTNMTVRVPDDGDAQVQWDTLETFLDGDVTVRSQGAAEGTTTTTVEPKRTWVRGKPWRTYVGGSTR